MIEVIAAIFLAATTTGICVQMLAALAHQQGAAERRTWAIESATNLMERFSAKDYNDVTSEAANQLTLPPEAAQVLPNAKLTVEVIEQQAPAPGKQIRLRLQWDTPRSERNPEVHLSAWVFQGGRPTP